MYVQWKQRGSEIHNDVLLIKGATGENNDLLGFAWLRLRCANHDTSIPEAP